MENLEERLLRLGAEGCLICGFTINNAPPKQQERFMELLPKAGNMEILALTELVDTNLITDEWRRRQAENYRSEKGIELHPERVEYFYKQTLPRLLNLLPSMPNLKELYLFNIRLSKEQINQIPSNLKLLT